MFNSNSSTAPTNKQLYLRLSTVEGLMKLIGNNGHFVLVRYDHIRDKYKFTVVIDNERLGDTDEPLELLKKYADEYLPDEKFVLFMG